MKTFSILLAAIIVAIAVTMQFTTNAADSIARSMAEIEQARAMQQQAEATTKAVSALGTVTVMDKLMQVLVLVLLISLVGLVVYIYFQNIKLRAAKTEILPIQMNTPKWAPGPNAGWKRLGEAQPTQISMQDAMAMTAMSVMASVVQQMRPAQPPTLPVRPQSRAQQPTTPYMINPENSCMVADYFGDQDLPSVQEGSEWDTFIG